MVHQLPVWIIISFVSVIIIFFIIGYFFIAKHLKKEREKVQIHKEINKIGRSEAKNKYSVKHIRSNKNKTEIIRIWLSAYQ